MAILAWMEEVATEVWRQRYGDRWKAVVKGCEGLEVKESSEEE